MYDCQVVKKKTRREEETFGRRFRRGRETIHNPHRDHLGGDGRLHYAIGPEGGVVQKPASIEASSKGAAGWRGQERSGWPRERCMRSHQEFRAFRKAFRPGHPALHRGVA